MYKYNIGNIIKGCFLFHHVTIGQVYVCKMLIIIFLIKLATYLCDIHVWAMVLI